MIEKIKKWFTLNSSFNRFVIVGVINTVNYYVLYLLFMKLGLAYVYSHSLGFCISMIGSFYLNCYFTYKTKPSWKKFIQFPMTYVVNYSVSTISLFVIVEWLQMNEYIAPVIAAFLPIPFTYLTSKWILSK